LTISNDNKENSSSKEELKTKYAAVMSAKLERNNEQLRAMQEQLSTLFQIMAIKESEERGKGFLKLQETG
jgi:hypothetical protein